jgi:hypothetical protein
LGPTAGGAAAALDAAGAPLSGARAAMGRTLPEHAAHGDGGPVLAQSGAVHRMGRPACQGAPQARSPLATGGELSGGGPASPILPPLVSEVDSSLETEAVSTSPLLASASVEVPFSRDVGCHTPPTSPTRAPSSFPSASSDRVASPPPPLRAVPCVPAPRRSTRHSVAEDGHHAEGHAV